MLSEKSFFTGMRFMPKEFFDVFPTLKVNDNLRGLLSQATVTRVTVTSARDRMRVSGKPEASVLAVRAGYGA